MVSEEFVFIYRAPFVPVSIMQMKIQQTAVHISNQVRQVNAGEGKKEILKVFS